MTTMDTSIRRLAAWLAAVALAPLLIAGAAQAKSLTWTDGSGDMWRLSEDLDEWTPAPEQSNGDVTKVRVAHRAHAVLVRQVFVVLARTGTQHDLVGRIRTNTGLTRQFEIQAEKGFWDGELMLTTVSGRHVRCDATHTLDYFTDSATLRVPRSCLDDPRWIQVKLANAHFGKEVWADNGQGPGHAFLRTWSDKIRQG